MPREALAENPGGVGVGGESVAVPVRDDVGGGGRRANCVEGEDGFGQLPGEVDLGIDGLGDLLQVFREDSDGRVEGRRTVGRCGAERVVVGVGLFGGAAEEGEGVASLGHLGKGEREEGKKGGR